MKRARVSMIQKPEIHFKNRFFFESCQPIILLRIYWCKGDEAPERKNKKHNAEREEQTMNNNMMELNMNEMELVNGGVNIFGAITGAVLGGLGGAALGGTFGGIPGAVVGGVAGAVTGAAVGGADYK